jgi:hypothetical protein
MFPHLHHSFEPVEKRRWRAGLRHALDVVVAFATLADADPLTRSEPRPRHRSNPSASPNPRRSELPASPDPRPSNLSASADPREPEPSDQRSSGPTLPPRSAAPSPPRSPHAHPHRRALAVPARSRRPGAVRAAPQPCLTPLPARHTGGGRTLVPTR